MLKQKPRKTLRRGRYAKGQSALELAFALPVLAVLLVMTADFARVFYVYIALNNAARAGVQYGSQSAIQAGDTNGMEAQAEMDGANVSNIAATASQCTCSSQSSSVAACASSYCGPNSKASFVQVNATATFTTILNYPGIPSSLPLSAKAIMQVQE
jgi:Flp pilus assembly protein TadG